MERHRLFPIGFRGQSSRNRLHRAERVERGDDLPFQNAPHILNNSTQTMYKVHSEPIQPIRTIIYQGMQGCESNQNGTFVVLCCCYFSLSFFQDRSSLKTFSPSVQSQLDSDVTILPYAATVFHVAIVVLVTACHAATHPIMAWKQGVVRHGSN